MSAILKHNADLVPAQSARYLRHPIVLPDGRVPCDMCDAAISIEEAERHFPAWMQHICNVCAGEYAAANPELAREAAERAVDINHPAAPPDVRSDLIEAVLAGGAA
jgi:hypothetical protein